MTTAYLYMAHNLATEDIHYYLSSQWPVERVFGPDVIHALVAESADHPNYREAVRSLVKFHDVRVLLTRRVLPPEVESLILPLVGAAYTAQPLSVQLFFDDGSDSPGRSLALDPEKYTLPSPDKAKELGMVYQETAQSFAHGQSPHPDREANLAAWWKSIGAPLPALF